MQSIKVIDNNHSFTFHDNQDGVILREFEGFEYPTTRPVIIDLPARNGALYIKNLFGRRRMSWSGDIVDDEVFGIRRNILLAMTVGELKTIQFTTYDGLELETYADILKVVMPYTNGVHNYLVEAVAPDYRFYSQEETTESTAITSIGGGVPVPFAIPMPIGGVSTNPLVVNNLGTIFTNPTITIHGPGTNFTVQNITTGQKMELQTTLTSNESVVIDTRLHTVMKGNQNLFGSFSGDWLTIQTGINNISFNVLSGDAANTLLSITYKSAWLGV